jgi:hypothetical protein
MLLVSGSSLQRGAIPPSPLEKSSNPREYPETYLKSGIMKGIKKIRNQKLK